MRISSSAFFDGVFVTYFLKPDVRKLLKSLWKNQLEVEAKRLALPVELLSSGDLFAPYASAGHFLDLLARYDRNPTIPIAALN